MLLPGVIAAIAPRKRCSGGFLNLRDAARGGSLQGLVDGSCISRLWVAFDTLAAALLPGR